jgi:hypothetical protein
MKSLMRNSAFDEALEREVYRQPALVPATPWLSGSRPGKPRLAAGDQNGSRVSVSWTPADGATPWLWLVQTRAGHDWTAEILPGARRSRTCDGAEAIAVSAVNRGGNPSSPAVLQIKK